MHAAIAGRWSVVRKGGGHAALAEVTVEMSPICKFNQNTLKGEILS